METHIPKEIIRTLIGQYYDIQEMRVEAFNRIVNYIRDHKDEIQDKELQELIANKKYSLVANKIIKSKEKYGDIYSKLYPLVLYFERLYKTEKELMGILDEWSKEHPLRVYYLSKVRGIGPVLSSGIIAYLSDPILKANHVSQIWSYCGLAPNQVRKKGQKANFNPRLKAFVVFRIGRSLLMFNKFAKKLYDKFKEDARNKHPDWSKMHLHNHARRKVVKLFLASVWEEWRKMNNLPVTKPYAIQILGHDEVITPEHWING